MFEHKYDVRIRKSSSLYYNRVLEFELNLNLELVSLCFTEEIKYIHFRNKI